MDGVVTRRLHVSNSLSLPATSVTETFAVLAVRGAGKTNAARVMAEEMFSAGCPFVAIDPVGSWWGLRAGRDSKKGGIPIPIFGGEHGDVPLERGGGQVVADLVVDQNVSCVLDLSAFESEGAKKAFLLAFAQRLYHRNRTPRHLFLEECDDYVPQRPQHEDAQLLRAWENIVRRGRSRGLGMTLITQRSAVVNKNVLTQVGTLITLRTTSPQDRSAVEAWIEFHGQKDDILATLSSLESGEAWVWSPDFLRDTKRFRFRLSTTFDSGATPKLGAAPSKAATLADVDLGALQERMAATIEKAKTEDPKALQAEVARLKRELAAKPAPKVERVEVPVMRDSHIERIEQVAEDVGKACATFAEVARELALLAGMCKMAKAQPPNNGGHRHGAPPARLPSSRVAAGRPAGVDDVEPLSGPEQRILDAIAWLETNNQQLAQEQAAVAFLAGYTVGGGAFNNPRGRLNTRGLIEYQGGRLALTDAGRARAALTDAVLTDAELHGRVLERLPGPEQKILRVLLDAYPGEVENDDLARRAGYEPGGGAFNNPRGRLRSLGLVVYPRKGAAAAAPVLFVGGAS